MDEDIRRLMADMEQERASDLHVIPHLRPRYRVDGEIVSAESQELSADEAERMCLSLLDDRQKEQLRNNKELDLSVGIEGAGRYRVNVYFHQGEISAAIRRLPQKIPNFEDLGLPPSVMEDLCEKNWGLVLVTGPTGSGKSTTMAAMIDLIKRKRADHIVCIEDPVEYVHTSDRGIVHQREVGEDTLSFANALKYVLRQDPDVVQIGEMRDLETVRSVLRVAETGHLAVSTLHTNTAVATINRIIDIFPPGEQEQVRVQLASVLEAVISQRLLPRADGDGRVLTCEIMRATPAIRNLIREVQTEQIYSQIQMGTSLGMQTMNSSLAQLTKAGKISEKSAKNMSPDLKELNRLLKAGA